MDQNDRSYRVAGEGKSPAAIVDRGARFVAPACSACRLLSFASWYPPWPPLCFVVVLVLHMDSATHSGASLAAPWCRAPCSVLACGRQSSAQPMLLWLCVRHEALLQRVVPSLTPRYRRHYCIYAIAHGCVIVSVRCPCTCAHRHRTDLGGGRRSIASECLANHIAGAQGGSSCCVVGTSGHCLGRHVRTVPRRSGSGLGWFGGEDIMACMGSVRERCRRQ